MSAHPLHTCFNLYILLLTHLLVSQEQLLALFLAEDDRRAGEWYVVPRSCHWRDQFLHRTNRIFCETSFRDSFRLNPSTVEALLTALGPHIEGTPTNFRMPVPARHRLLIYLYYVAHGVSFQVLSNQFAYGRSTISNIIHLVSWKIREIIAPEYIRWPDARERSGIVQRTLEESGIPNCVAYIDGTHMEIARPAKNGDDYFNRKCVYSTNVLGRDDLHWHP